MNAPTCRLLPVCCLQAIVRYASASYTESTAASARTSFLTNTFVGKQHTGGGVGAITGSLAELGEHLAPQVYTGSSGSSRVELPHPSHPLHRRASQGLPLARLLDRMRESIGLLFLAAERSFGTYYAREPTARLSCHLHPTDCRLHPASTPPPLRLHPASTPPPHRPISRPSFTAAFTAARGVPPCLPRSAATPHPAAHLPGCTSHPAHALSSQAATPLRWPSDA